MGSAVTVLCDNLQNKKTSLPYLEFNEDCCKHIYYHTIMQVRLCIIEAVFKPGYTFSMFSNSLQVCVHYMLILAGKIFGFASLYIHVIWMSDLFATPKIVNAIVSRYF